MSELMMYNPLLVLAKKAKDMGFDFSTLLEIAGTAGLQLNLPCMQCYEANRDHHSLPKGYQDSSTTGRCAKCGGQVSTIQSFSSMISNSKKLLVEKQFEFHDVYPDGNCMLRTIVDQLRVSGNFRFTIYSLREVVVDYLRKNPNAEDGTPLAMFLSGETWEEYLSRMSEDGQWGDHLVLKAVSNILQIHLVIYGGISGETETNIAPEDTYDGSLPVINMLHMGETHYVSLRPKNWRQELQEENHKYLELWKQSDSRINAPFEFMMYPVMHLDFILRHTISLDYISSFLSENVSKMPDQKLVSDEVKISMVGAIVCKLSPTCSNPTQSIDLDASLIFPVMKEKDIFTHYLIKFKILINTDIHRRGSTVAQPFDLYVEYTDASQLLVQLIPVVRANWEAQTLPSGPGSVCLKAIDLPKSTHEEKHTEDCIVKYQELVAFQCMWPDSANEWLLRERPSNFPTSTIVHSIKTNGCHIIPVISVQTENDVIDCVVTQEMVLRQNLWCYSFAEAEKEICRALLDDQRHCYLILKICIDTVCKASPVPTSLLKSVFFYACEHIVGPDWKREPGQCILIMLDKLIQGLERKYVPHYFIPQENLIQTIPEASLSVWIRGLEYMRFDPITMLYFTFDSIGLTSTEVGGMFDEVIDDLLQFGRHKNLQLSFQESLVPAAGHMVQSLIYLGDFQSAVAIIENLNEQWNIVSYREVSLIYTIRIATGSMALGYRWCLGFMFDIKFNTNITEEMCHSMDSIHITEMFGPDIVEEMPNTVVPAVYGIPNGDLVFPRVCTQVIEQTGNMNVLAKSLRYYLDTYSCIAGENLVIDAQNSHTQQCSCACGQCGRRIFCIALLRLYVKLLDAYVDINQVESFRELMPVFASIVQAAGDQGSYNSLAYAWEMLGEKEIALQCRQGVSSPVSNMEQCLSSLFKMLGVK